MSEEILNADYSGRTFRAASFANVKMVDADLSNARLSGNINGLQINGIEVAPLIAEEMRRRYPERDKLFAADPDSLRAAFAQYMAMWERTWERARKFTEEQRQQRVDGEWSVVETIRHLVFVVDGWIRGPVLGVADPYHPMAIPPTFMDGAYDRTPMDRNAHPDFDEALAVWRERMAVVQDVIERSTQDLDRDIEVQRPDLPPPGFQSKTLAAIWTVFGDGHAHNRFVNRDLDAIESGEAPR